MSKDNVLPYESLVAFANEEITRDNWREVLNRLGSRPVPNQETDEQAFRRWSTIYRRLGFLGPQRLEGKKIAGPYPLLSVQEELREDLARLTSPGHDLQPSSADFWNFVQSGEAQREMEAHKDMAWLVKKINSIKRKGKPRRTTHADGKNPVWVQRVGEIEIPMRLFVPRVRPGDYRALLTDQVYFVPVVEDLRDWVYFRLVQLWADGLLSRIGRCQRCTRFFLGKTQREKRMYCSQRCAQNVTAAQRVKASRSRRIAWESAREHLDRSLNTQDARNRERAFAKAQHAFVAAYPRQKGPGYKEGKQLLARVSKQAQQPGKK